MSKDLKEKIDTFMELLKRQQPFKKWMEMNAGKKSTSGTVHRVDHQNECIDTHCFAWLPQFEEFLENQDYFPINNAIRRHINAIIARGKVVSETEMSIESIKCTRFPHISPYMLPLPLSGQVALGEILDQAVGSPITAFCRSIDTDTGNLIVSTKNVNKEFILNNSWCPNNNEQRENKHWPFLGFEIHNKGKNEKNGHGSILLKNKIPFNISIRRDPSFYNFSAVNGMKSVFCISDNISFLSSEIECDAESSYEHMRKRQNNMWSNEKLTKGIELAKCGKLTEALTEYDHSIALNAENTDAYVARGAAYANKSHYEKAITDFSWAIRLDENCSKARAFLQRVEEKVKSQNIHKTEGYSAKDSAVATSLLSTASIEQEKFIENSMEKPKKLESERLRQLLEEEQEVKKKRKRKSHSRSSKKDSKKKKHRKKHKSKKKHQDESSVSDSDSSTSSEGSSSHTAHPILQRKQHRLWG